MELSGINKDNVADVFYNEKDDYLVNMLVCAPTEFGIYFTEPPKETNKCDKPQLQVYEDKVNKTDANHLTVIVELLNPKEGTIESLVKKSVVFNCDTGYTKPVIDAIYDIAYEGKKPEIKKKEKVEIKPGPFSKPKGRRM